MHLLYDIHLATIEKSYINLFNKYLYSKRRTGSGKGLGWWVMSSEWTCGAWDVSWPSKWKHPTDSRMCTRLDRIAGVGAIISICCVWSPESSWGWQVRVIEGACQTVTRGGVQRSWLGCHRDGEDQSHLLLRTSLVIFLHITVAEVLIPEKRPSR